PWLHRIVVNRAIDWTRSRSLRRELGGDLVGEQPASSADRTVPVSDEVVRALATLSPEHRAVVVLRFLLEYTPGEIAGVLELPRGTVNSRLRRALDAPKDSVEEEQA
ncbi:MAG: RNA polymerase sigma factor, partial [Gaiellaceae bacterium]